ncbi:class I SAM-dependent methyltransferase [Gottfriedia acidiceleris]|uniref:class I SAM-dependent methyltransferase n=1 Tax=Gottfriedia acidiceleris TaxID=371036 RepID=UPI003D211A05
MDRNKFSEIAHRNHTFYNPVSVEKINRILQYASIQSGNKIIDIGAGTCELLIRMVEYYGVLATAIELYEGAIDEAKRRAADRIPLDSIQFIKGDAKIEILQLADHTFDMGICIGSTHALGGLVETLDTLRKCVKKGGYILIGEGYWKQQPSEEYLKAIGAEESELRSHFENVKEGEQLGLIPLWSYTTNEDEWDEYEWLYAMSIENYCYEHPDDPDHDAMLQRIRMWRSTYLKWGRDTLGFSLYLFRNV